MKTLLSAGPSTRFADVRWRMRSAAAAFSAGACLVGAASGEEAIDFNRDIRPILSNNCLQCHGPDEKTRDADLRLDTFEDATADLGGYAAIVPGNPVESELLFRVSPDAGDDRMPPAKSKKPPLSDRERRLLERWIAEGARYAGHWAFQPLADPDPPMPSAPWIINEVDAFVLRKLQTENLEPSPMASREILIRRAYLDVLGVLPALKESRAFLESSRPDAWERLVDRVLASPHYGERWGRHWLDQARYADSHGYSIDGERDMWPYRDWVIKAFNEDIPFNQFTIDQLAGDLLPEADKQQLIATAFHRNTLINQEGGSDPEQFRVEAVMDRVNTTAAVWLGLTLGCAQCHTHKFDPITQREYYAFFAFFNSGTDKNNAGATVEVAEGEVFGLSSPSESNRNERRPGRRNSAARLMVMEDLVEPRETYLLTRGDFTRPDHERGPLRPGVLEAVPPRWESSSAPMTRLDLARWLVSEENPLTPRVTINRVWMRYFGRGLVETEEDFGTQGSYPSHPDLLDWLGRSWIEHGWSMKALHRLILTSATYRQASELREDLREKDPRNVYLARQSRLRVEGEIVRDAALTASGLLVREIGGASVRPPQPDGIYAFTQNKKRWNEAEGADRYRRGLYTFFYRSAPYPLFTTFDAPNFQTVCTRRPRSNTPLQALNVANDPAFLEFAQALARRMMEAGDGLEERLRHGFLRALNRVPTAHEMDILADYTKQQEVAFREDRPAAEALLTDWLREHAAEPAAGAALVCAARVLINTDNFITRE